MPAPLPDPEAARAVDCTALSPGLWRVALPFPSPLKHSYSYLLAADDGVVAVDTGWDLDDGWNLFVAGLARAGWSLDDLRGVVVTHAHPDHYGLTRRVQETTDAWIGLHPAEQPQLVPEPGDPERRVEQIEAWLADCGAPHDEVESLLVDRERLLVELSSNLPTLDLLDGSVVPGTGGSLTAIHTPGHTAGHLVFHDRARGVVFTGDHLLPRVSANVSVRPWSSDDPLGDYQSSLDALTPFRDSLAAPGHEWAFDRPGQRLDAVRRHHEDRLAEVLRAVEDGATTAWEVSQTISWSRPFSTLNARGRRSAVGEAAAHLVRLERDGRLVHVGDSPTRWTT